MAAFVTHPSVRIKGTEINFEPVYCTYPKCAADRPLHMHCPFCVKTEVYVNPEIIKAHYRVKHVDKGLDFAGLKILRCCDHCDIVGTIKGEKKFKHPHWHCYKCRNGFNRRDEAIKHYRTHFRNPQTTFQIQVAQEVNVMLNNIEHTENTGAVESIDHNDFNMNAASLVETEEYYVGDSIFNEQKVTEETVAANETVDNIVTCTDIKMLHDPDSYEQSHCQTVQLSYEELIADKLNLERHIETLENDLKLMETISSENESLKTENDCLHKQVEDLSEEVKKYRVLSSIEGSEHLERLIDDLQSKHRELMYEQLLRVRMEHQTGTMLQPDLTPNNADALELQEAPPSKRSKSKCSS